MIQYLEQNQRNGAMEAETIKNAASPKSQKSRGNQINRREIKLKEAETISKNAASPKSYTGRRNFLFYGMLLIVFCGFTFMSCKKDDFSGPEDYISNPSVKAAINESRIEVNKGDNPPPLAGTYSLNGSVIDASGVIRTVVGLPINTEFELFNQTASGKISFRERVGGISASGSGGYITGDNGKFTIYLESNQSGAEAGLPNDISLEVVLLMSGNKYDSGNLRVKGISIINKVRTTNKEYNTKSIEGCWWMWDADFYLQAGTRSDQVSIEKKVAGLFFNERMTDAILGITIPE